MKRKKEMRKPGIEPGAQRWQRWILPLNHLRLFLFNVSVHFAITGGLYIIFFINYITKRFQR